MSQFKTCEITKKIRMSKKEFISKPPGREDKEERNSSSYGESKKIILAENKTGGNNFNAWKEALTNLLAADKDLQLFSQLLTTGKHAQFSNYDAITVYSPLMKKGKLLCEYLKKDASNEPAKMALSSLVDEYPAEFGELEIDASATGAGLRASTSKKSASSSKSSKTDETIVFNLILDVDCVIASYEDQYKAQEEERRELRSVELSRRSRYEDNKRPCFQRILATVSAEVHENLLRQDTWAEVEAKSDPLMLIVLIGTLYRNKDRSGVVSATKLAERLRGSYYSMKCGHNEPENDFHRRWRLLLKEMDNAGIMVTDDAAHAERVYSSIDRVRYASMIEFHENEVASDPNRAFKTAHEVWERCGTATLMHPDKRRAGESVPASMFTTQFRTYYASKEEERAKSSKGAKTGHDQKFVEKRASASAGASAGGGGASEYPDVQCYNCHEFGHYRSDCPGKAKPSTKGGHGKTLLSDEKKGVEKKEKKSAKVRPKAKAFVAAQAHCDREDEDTDSQKEYRPGGVVPKTSLVIQLMCFANRAVGPVLEKNEAIIDCACTHTVTNDLLLLDDVRDLSGGEVFMEGLGGVLSKITQEGTLHPYGKCYYCQLGGVTCISWRQLTAPNYEKGWMEKSERFVVRARSEDFRARYFSLKARHGLFTTDLSVAADGRHNYVTVAQKKLEYSAREWSEAKTAREMMSMLGVPTETHAIQMMVKDANDAPQVPIKAFKDAQDIWGTPTATLRGKSREPENTRAPTERVSRPIEKRIELFADVIFVKQQAYLLGVYKPGGFVMIRYLGYIGEGVRRAPFLYEAVKAMASGAGIHGFELAAIHFDGEKGIETVGDKLQSSLGVQMVSHRTGHVGDVENLTKLVKSWARGIVCTLPFVLCRLLYQWLLCFVVHRINLLRFKRGLSGMCAAEYFVGTKVNWRRDVRFAFGAYCEATIPNQTEMKKKAIDATRTESCICLCPYDVLKTNMCWMLNVKTKRLVSRKKFDVKPTTDAIILEMNRWANEKKSSNNQEIIPIEDCLSDHEEYGLIQSQEQGEPELVRPVETIHDEETHDVDDVHDNDNFFMEDIEVDDANEMEPEPVADMQGVHGDGNDPEPEPFYDEPFYEPEPDEDVVPEVMTAVSRPVQPYAFRPRRNEIDYARLAKGFNISVRKAMAKDVEKATNSIRTEIFQIDDKEGWTPVEWDSLSLFEKRRALRSFLFLKEKIDIATGEVERMKSRLVVDGKLQSREGVNTDAPAGAWSSVLLHGVIAAKEKRRVVVMDVEGAFLEAKIPSGHEKIHVIIEAEYAVILCEKCPEYRKYLRKDGCLVVKLNKALYGCIESAKMWYVTLSMILCADGFVVNEYDPCVFNKTSHGKQISLVIYVDDIMASSVSDEAMDELICLMKKSFRKVVVNEGKVHKYLGAIFDFSTPGKLRVDMRTYEAALVKDSGVTKTKTTPAAADLFTVNDELELSDSKVQTQFRSDVMKIAFLAKHTRLELLTVISFLSTRIGKVNIEDEKKLLRVFEYLNGNSGLGICFSFDEDEKIELMASIDASYAPHVDGKSHTGVVILVGNGPIYAKSTKQKAMVKSSWEAELMAISDGASQVIWSREFLIAQGYDMPPARIENDNQGTIKSILKGRPSSSQSRHVRLRHFWVSERINDGELSLHYCATDLMIADLLTKPLQGEKFVQLRSKLLNWN